MHRSIRAVAAGLLTACLAFPAALDARPDASDAVARKLVGTWTRTVRGDSDAVEGVVFDGDGRFGLIGIHSMNGVSWRVENGRLLIATNTGRYPDPTESRLRIESVDHHALELGADASYLAGKYQRHDDAAARIVGTVTYLERIALGGNAAVYLELREHDPATGTTSLIASQALASRGKQVPLPFHIHYATADVDTAKRYTLQATIWLRGNKLFESKTPQPVLTDGAPDKVHLVVRPVVLEAAPGPGDDDRTARPITALFRYMADAALARACGTREVRPVATEGDYAALERAYLARPEAGPAGEPVLVTFVGSVTLRPRMDGQGSEEAWYVERFDKLLGGDRCPAGD